MRVAIYSPDGGIVDVDAAVARTPAERALGFARRPNIGPNEAIFFTFPQDTTLAFTMAETLVPLDIVFIDRLGRVAHVARGQPLDRKPYVSPRAYRHVLELPAGWLAHHGVARPTSVGWSPRSLGVVV